MVGITISHLVETQSSSQIKAILKVINDAYNEGERGILTNYKKPGKDLERATKEDVEEWIRKGMLMVLTKQNNDVIGCVKGEVTSDPKSVPRVGEWGCLAVKTQFQGLGYGKQLVRNIEFHLTHVHKCKRLQIDLIAPSSWKHSHKERLRKWYTSSSMGYELQFPNDYEASTTRFHKGQVLFDTYLLDTDAEVTKYVKNIGANDLPGGIQNIMFNDE